jgi:hypothetical protein
MGTTKDSKASESRKAEAKQTPPRGGGGVIARIYIPANRGFDWYDVEADGLKTKIARRDGDGRGKGALD